MKCRICQNEIDISVRRQDNSVICPICGTVYRRKTQSDYSGSVKEIHDVNPQNEKNRQEDYAAVQETSAPRDNDAKKAYISDDNSFVTHMDELSGSNEKNREREAHKLSYQWESHCSDASSENLIRKTQRAEEIGKKAFGSCRDKKAIRRLALILLISAAFVACFYLTTGKSNLNSTKANNRIDPNKDVIGIIPDQTLPGRDEERYFTVVADEAEMHSRPEISAEVVGILHKGEIVKYLGQRKQEDNLLWYEIDKNGTDGWISSLLLRMKNSHSSGDETDSLQQSLTLNDFKVIDDDMRNLLIGTNTHLCFTVQCNVSSSAEVYLYRADTQEIIGQMKDDGKGEDEAAGDGIYTYGFNTNGKQYGRAVYEASYNSCFSNTEIIRFYEEITEERLITAQSMLDEMYSISLLYSNGKVFFTQDSVDNIDKALDAVELKVSELYMQGEIAEYNRDDFSVYFKDSVTGIPMVYSPPIAETKGSGDEMTVTAFFPYASDGMAKDAVLSSIYMLDTEFDHISFETNNQFDDGNVNPNQIISKMGKNQVIFWDGHGGYNSEVHTFLITGKNSNDLYVLFHSDDFRKNRMLLSSDNRVAITSKFIDEYCGDLSGSFVFISTCHSMQDSELAGSFRNKDASVVCGFNETVYVAYEKAIIKEFFTNMTRVNPVTGKYYTVMEAMRATVPYVSFTDNQYIGLKYPDVEVDPKNAATLSFIGDTNYRFGEYGIAYPTVTPTYAPQPTATAVPQMNASDFNIVGKWKSTGTYGFGQAQPGTIVHFDGTYCNFYSPRDTYSVYLTGGKLVLDLTSFLFRENLTFDIQIIDKDHIRVIYSANSITELTRVN